MKFAYIANEILNIYYNYDKSNDTGRKIAAGVDINVLQRLDGDSYGDMVMLGDLSGWIDLTKCIPKSSNDAKVILDTSGNTSEIESVNYFLKVSTDTTSKISPTENANIVSTLTAGDTFESNGRTYINGTTWYRRSDNGQWVNGNYLIKTSKSEVNAERSGITKIESIQDAEKYNGYKAISVSTQMNLRRSPDSSAAIANEFIDRGEVRSVSGEYTDPKGNKWYYLADGSGWISAEYNGVQITTQLGDCDETGSASTTSRKVIADSLNFRTVPDATNPNTVIGNFSKGDVIHLTGETKTVNDGIFTYMWEQCTGKDIYGNITTGWICSASSILDMDGSILKLDQFVTSDLKAVNSPSNVYKANANIVGYASPGSDEVTAVIQKDDDFTLTNDKQTIDGKTYYKTTSGLWILLENDNATEYTSDMIESKMFELNQDQRNQIQDVSEAIVDFGNMNSDPKYLRNLRVKDLYGVFGAPYQFSRVTDMRTGVIENGEFKEDGYAFGRVYTQKILSKIPLLLITPGVPSFMGDAKAKERKAGIFEYIRASIANEAAEFITEKETRFYTLDPKWDDFWSYVNPMARSGAFFLGIQDEDITIGDYKAKYGNIRLEELYRTGNSNFFRGFRQFAFGQINDGAEVGGEVERLAFYTNADVTINESWVNSTQSPSVADTVNGWSAQARELNYLLGNLNAQTGGQFDEFLKSLGTGIDEDMAVGTIADSIAELLNGSFLKGTAVGGIVSSVSKTASAIIQGSKMIFPELWADSTYGQEYTINIKLSTPDRDPKSWWLNVYVPMCVCLGLTCPRTLTSMNAFHAPFIISANYKNMFNVPMGIVTSLSMTKGGDSAWSIQGLPSTVEISMSIKDLYSAFAITSMNAEAGTLAGQVGAAGIMTNIFQNAFLNNSVLMDWIATSCGVSSMRPDIERDFEMFISFMTGNKLEDALYDIKRVPTKVASYLGTLVSEMFGFRLY